MQVVKIALFEVFRMYLDFCTVGYSLRSANTRFQLTKLLGGVGDQGEYATISSLGPGELERMSLEISVEARMAMELQFTGLFGDVIDLESKFNKLSDRLGQAIEDGDVANLRLSTVDLVRLMLEAAAYGALLNDAEKQINCVYELEPLNQGYA
jgi:hypothetical protein